MNLLPHISSFSLLLQFLLIVSIIGTLSSSVFLGMVIVAAQRYKRISEREEQAARAVLDSELPPVSVLKPVHGVEPRLAENLASFFEQDYPNFEVVIGARDAENSALAVAREVCARYPHIPSRIVLSGTPTWPNAKAFSLEKMVADARHSYLVLSDSDVLAERRLLRNVIAPLLDPRTGAVTCVYQGIPAGGMASLIEALGMSVEMTSGVLVADMMEGMRFALGLVIASRRDVIEAFGGMRMTADFYSDDFVFGNEVWKAGYKVELSHEKVGHVLLPRSWRETLGDQLRWMKSTRYSRPAGHFGTGLTFAVPFGILGLVAAWAAGHPGLGVLLLAISLANRIVQSIVVGWGIVKDPRSLKYCWLYPLRDLVGFGTWVGSYLSRDFYWRGETYSFGRGGKITPKLRPSEFVSIPRPR